MFELNIKAKPVNLFPTCLEKHVFFQEKVGSRAVCIPPPLDTDDDRLLWFYLKNTMKDAVDELTEEGWEVSKGYEELPTPFISMKKPGNNINLILTEDRHFFYRFVLANEVCKKANVLNKDVRIAIHNSIINYKDA